ncbi:hypothetical protein [Luteimonas fraxinea]|uniref:hypothetical protein n=1 Tax=Luteimonas fraxinea TaxID=2901869 RepID=UPI001E5344CB|nr:hypothetical protein [Luteimonas fraxinea]
MALGLLFLLLWAATLGPAAMAVTLSSGVSAQSVSIEHGGETPPTPDTTPSLSSSRTTPRLHLPAADSAFAATAMPGLPASRRRRLARRLRPAVAPPHHSPPRRQHRGRAPPR